MIKVFNPDWVKKNLRGWDRSEFAFSAPGVNYAKFLPTLDLYTHDRATVDRIIREMQWPGGKPPKFPISIYLAPYSEKLGPNAYCHVESDWIGSKDKEYYGYKEAGILMLGRSTPIPHAMTEYVLPHEIGHAYQAYFLNRDTKHPTHGNWKAYLKLRRFRGERRSDRWHQYPSEVFANDFRFFFSKYQKDFWPHDVARPDRVPGLKEFMQKVLKPS